MKSSLGLVILATFGIVSASLVNATILHTADSESGSLMEWPHQGAPNTSQMCCGSQSAQFLNSDTSNGGPSSPRAGSKFLKLTRTANQALAPITGYGNRVEVSAAGFRKEKHQQDWWLGASIYVPSSFDTSVVNPARWHSIMQWHDVGPLPAILQVTLEGDNDAKISSLNYNGSPPSGDWWNHVTTNNHYQFKMPRDRWVDFAYHARWDHRPNSQGGRGRLEVWIDGEKVVDYSGPIGFQHGTNSASTYFKMGSYASEQNPFDRTMYFDEVRFGDQASSLNEVSPSGSQPSSSAPANPAAPQIVVK